MNLTNILKEMLEASLVNDANKSVKAKEYIKKIDDLIARYRSDNKEIEVKGVGSYSYVEVHLDGVDVNILPTNKGNIRSLFHTAHQGKEPYIDVYRAIIRTEPKLDVEFDEKSLYHELIHFLDFTKIKTSPEKLGGAAKRNNFRKHGYKAYINSPLEVNAHFFEYFMPIVVKYIEKEKKIPTTYDKFENDLLRNREAKEFIYNLDDKNKKKLKKRLGTYYTDILKNPDFKIEKGSNIDDQQLKKATNGFISKLKSILHIK